MRLDHDPAAAPQPPIDLGRRRLVRGLSVAGAAAFFTTPGLFAEALTLTPRQTEGPFYPDKLPLDTDNDLIRLNDATNPALGDVTHLTGRVLDPSGEPLRNAVVEIWQVDAKGSYLHSRGAVDAGRDAHFQGFGRFLTGSKGEYYFRTIKPVAYPGRTPHIHVAVNRGGKRILTTQCYVKGEKQNERDRLLGRLRGDKKAYESVVIDFAPLEGSQAGELAARFDLVIGHTPEDE